MVLAAPYSTIAEWPRVDAAKDSFSVISLDNRHVGSDRVFVNEHEFEHLNE